MSEQAEPKVGDRVRHRDSGHIGTVVKVGPEMFKGWGAYFETIDREMAGSWSPKSWEIVAADAVEEAKPSQTAVEAASSSACKDLVSRLDAAEKAGARLLLELGTANKRLETAELEKTRFERLVVRDGDGAIVTQGALNALMGCLARNERYIAKLPCPKLVSEDGCRGHPGGVSHFVVTESPETVALAARAIANNTDYGDGPAFEEFDQEAQAKFVFQASCVLAALREASHG